MKNKTITYIAEMFFTVLYNLIILGTTTYYVFEKGFSAWFFLLAVLLLANQSREKEEKEKEEQPRYDSFN